MIKSMFEGITEPKLVQNEAKHKKTMSNGALCGSKKSSSFEKCASRSRQVSEICHEQHSLTKKEIAQIQELIEDSGKGLIPRVLDTIYDSHPNRDKFELKISFLEIYNDVVTDLLDTEQTTSDFKLS